MYLSIKILASAINSGVEIDRGGVAHENSTAVETHTATVNSVNDRKKEHERR
jgi:hypothetical protein